MNDFSWQCRTNLIFGEKQIEKLPKLIAKNHKIMVLYGGGSIKKNGIYNRVMESLKGYSVTEFSGIEPNPHYETCLKAIEKAKAEKVSFILAVGGGSVMDAAKFIALGSCYNGVDPWSAIILQTEVVNQALEVAMIATLPATGSEMNEGFVISNVALKEKKSGHYKEVMPLFSILEPSSTLTLDQNQTSNGIADAYIHTVEQYVNQQTSCPLQDRWSEGVLTTLIGVAPKLMANGQDLEARRTMMFSATMALNHIIGMGVTQDWATHIIGHQLTAFYGLDHGKSLTIIWPAMLKVRKEAKKEKILMYGKNVFGISQGSDAERIEQTIKATEDFFKSIKMPIRLSDVNIGSDAIEKVASNLVGCAIGEDAKIDNAMVKEIVKMAL